MANEEHLRILGEGVDRWNQWRKDNPDTEPDLYMANLSGMFTDVSFDNANLSDAHLLKVDFSWASLRGVNFNNSELTSADFWNADLAGSDLRMANLSAANFVRANMSNVNLTGANLTMADLSAADFSLANLIKANLDRTIALGTNFTQAILTEVCIQDWNINLETIFNETVCDCFYLKNEQMEIDWKFPNRSNFRFFERRPSDRNKIFAPGDFAKLVRKSLETVDLIFSNGIDWKAFFDSFGNLQLEHGEQNLSIRAIENKDDGTFVIRLNASPDADKEAIERRYWEIYEPRLKAQEERLALQGEQLMFYREQVEIERKNNTNLQGVIKTMAENQSSKVTQNFHAPVGGVAGNVEGNMNVYSPEQRQTLAEAATEIQQLLEQLSQTYPTTTQAEKLAVAAKAAEEIEANPALRSRVIGALKAGGVEALKELVDHPLVTILLAALEGWQQPESK